MIITSDLHFTANPRDSYRWELIDFLRGIEKDSPKNDLFILGDLTDAKDKHPAELVNRISMSIGLLAKSFNNVYILKGNHDYIDPNTPFFQFLGGKDDSNIHFIVHPESVKSEGYEIALLPHARDPDKEWGLWADRCSKADYIFLHQGFEGARASNGTKMEGMKPSVFKPFKARCISGDIHVPQKVGPITYVGSPYHVHFGDNFTPRILRIGAEGKESDIHFDAIKKHSLSLNHINDIEDLGLRPGDQVKIKLVLPRSDFSSWQEKKQEAMDKCAALGLEVFGIEIQERKRRRLSKKNQNPTDALMSNKEVFDEYCQRERLSDVIVKAGEKYL